MEGLAYRVVRRHEKKSPELAATVRASMTHPETTKVNHEKTNKV